MATDRCLATLLESKDFGALSTADQAARLATFMSSWFDLDQTLDTVDNVRWTARLRTHAAKQRISAGEVLELLLPTARKLHAQSVYETEAARIWDEDRRAANDLDTSEQTEDGQAESAVQDANNPGHTVQEPVQDPEPRTIHPVRARRPRT